MKRLLLTFLLLLAVAGAATFLAIGLAGEGPFAGMGASRVLVWHLDDPLLDYVPSHRLPFVQLLPADSIASVYRALDRARRDPSIHGLALHLHDARFGLAKAQELRRLLVSVRDAGKFVECHLETAGEGANGTLDYYLATACGSIALTPAGELNLLGLYSASQFFRGTLDKLRIDPDFTHVGEYKSAAESYTEYEHSSAAEEALTAVLDDFYEQIVGGVSIDRKLPPERVREIVDGAPYSADEALALGLVDRLLYPDEFDERIEELLGGEAREVTLADYDQGTDWGRGPRVAVLFAQGVILRGGSGIDPWTDVMYLGSDEAGELLRSFREDDSLAAVVLRIDSPGGSALASDLILREVTRLAEAKPVVVSMSDVAASGGYYIAARARKIVAEPATVTGSIGVVGGKLVTRRFQHELLGISYDVLQRGANADLYSTLQPFSPEQEARYQQLMEKVYDTFLSHVAGGRAMSREQAEAVAGGRIWTGSMARERGLVDELGGLDTALDLVRTDLGLASGSRLRIEYYPRPTGFFELLLDGDVGALPARLLTLHRALSPRASGLLELSPEQAGLARPF